MIANARRSLLEDNFSTSSLNALFFKTTKTLETALGIDGSFGGILRFAAAGIQYHTDGDWVDDGLSKHPEQIKESQIAEL